jgi:tetratricopeptide (TPR) repeat protein
MALHIKKIAFIICLIVAILGGGWLIYTFKHSNLASNQLDIDSQIIQGEKLVNKGRYKEAKTAFEAVVQSSPQNHRAVWDLRKARSREISSRYAYKQILDNFYTENPDDPHVNLFLGEFYLADEQPEQAKSFFDRALELNFDYPEAHFHKGELYEQQDKLEAAKNEYALAIDIIPAAKYHTSLAHLYLKQRHFDLAITEFEKNSEYPLSALESAKIYWQRDQLGVALMRQLQAIEWLTNNDIMAMPENQDVWVFPVEDDRTVKLNTVDKKKAYAYFSVAVTLFLLDNRDEAENYMQKMRVLDIPRPADLDAIMNSDLDTFILELGSYAPKIGAFRKLYL